MSCDNVGLAVWEVLLGQEDPLEKEMATHASILAWRIPWTEESGRLLFTVSQRVRHDWPTSLSFCWESFLKFQGGKGLWREEQSQVRKLLETSFWERKDGSPCHQYSPGPISQSQDIKTGVENLGESKVAATTLELPASHKILTPSPSMVWR